MRNRSYNLELTIKGKFSLTPEEVEQMILSGNKTMEKRGYGWQMIHAATGGDPVTEDNFDKVFEKSVAKGFRDAARKGEMEDVRGLTGISVSTAMVPRGKAITEGKADE